VHPQGPAQGIRELPDYRAVVLFGGVILWWAGRKKRRIGSELARMQADIDAED
jgi:hypothetical protein